MIIAGLIIYNLKKKNEKNLKDFFKTQKLFQLTNFLVNVFI